MPTAEYARTVVAELAKTNPRGSLWAGSNANLSWLVETFLPRRIMVRIRETLFLSRN